MSTVPGQDAKDKGNAAFKSGDFPAAIGHYTAAILADPKNPTYRSTASMNEDAERDCDVTIRLDQRNVKARFRRGQARIGLDKLEGARDDFKRTLQLDSTNEAAKQELAKVEALLQYRSANAGKKRTPIDVTVPPSASRASSNGSVPRRRRVPINIVDTPSLSTSSPVPAKSQAETASEPKKLSNIASVSTVDDFMKPVSTRTLTPSTSAAPAATLAPSSKSASFKDLKQAREANKSSPGPAPSTSAAAPTSPQPASPPAAVAPPRAGAGGGIFRSNGKHTIFGSSTQGADVPKSESSAPPKPASAASGQGPMSLFTFNRTWANIDSPESKWSFLIDNVPPASLPAMFKTSLEAPLLVSVLGTFKFILAEHDDNSSARDSVKAYLLSFARVPRFSTIMMFMSKYERTLVKEVWDGITRTDDQVEVGVRKVWGVL
ncbi:uncharacterized protein PHACADRAFT_204723 [Phanerochaete carnosa HHB-10118-sp]|uniref:RNA polymerase II-associated protein 3 n=1 Tax=Phanerochaete carnosa (strain HHB-10118-sp) TaxID=650164 RepID=K5WQM6_PHACS|nr:uncharacterized protein PHACADRAFT_204723 [Phanerochaete carnosa HHB-10118-sp]EKM61554.1 hypothetical protein PHACADRAFT_204723 [Phanerochaete carnosa HHB-10118-sp]